MALFTFKKCFPFDICLNQIMRAMALFSTSFCAKCLRVGEDSPGLGYLCHIDTFLVVGCIDGLHFYDCNMYAK